MVGGATMLGIGETSLNQTGVLQNESESGGYQYFNLAFVEI
jgi:hypothetical protein